MDEHAAEGTPLVVSLSWGRSVSFSWSRGISISRPEMLVGYYKKSRLGPLNALVVEIDGIELFLTNTDWPRVAGKILDFKNEKFTLLMHKECERNAESADDSPLDG